MAQRDADLGRARTGQGGFEKGDSLRRAAVLGHGGCAAGERRRVARRHRERPDEGGLRFLAATEPGEGEAAIGVEVRIDVRLARGDKPVHLGQRGAKVLQLQQAIREVEARGGKARRDRQRAAEAFRRLRLASHGPEHVPRIVQQLGVVRRVAQRGIERREGGSGVARGEKCQAEQPVHLDAAAVEGQQPSIGGDRFAEPPGLMQCDRGLEVR